MQNKIFFSQRLVPQKIEFACIQLRAVCPQFEYTYRYSLLQFTNTSFKKNIANAIIHNDLQLQ